jgi:hypothetical protein
MLRLIGLLLLQTLLNPWVSDCVFWLPCTFHQIPCRVKMTVFWVVAPCNPEKFTDVSEVLAAPIRAISDDGGSRHP